MAVGSNFAPSPNRIEGDARVSGSLTISGDLVVQGSTVISGSGEANTASNLGAGQGFFAGKNIVDLQFRSLVGAGIISIISGTDEITISASITGALGEINTASSTGSGESLFDSKRGVDLVFRSISGSGGVVVISGSDGTIILSSSNAVASVSGINLGTGEPVFSHTATGTFVYRTLVGAGSVSIVSGANEITISGTPGEVASATSLGGESVFANKIGTVFNFRGLTGSGSISIVSGANEINISSSAQNNQGENIGAGQGIYLDNQGNNLRLRSIAGQGAITVSSGTSGTINISGVIPTGQINQGENIGTGQGIYLDNQGSNLRLRSIAGQGFITVSSGTSGTIIVSGSQSGENNTASNLGGGQGVFASKAGIDLQFRSLTVSGNLSITSGTNEINISASGEANTASNTGSGQGVWLDKQGLDLRFRTLVGAGGATVSSGTNGTIQISSTIPVGEINDGSNLGVGQGPFAGKSGPNLQFRSLTVSGNLSIASGTTSINISSSAEINTASNTGTGEGVWLDKQGVDLRFRSLVGAGGATVSSGTNGTIQISSTIPVGEINDGLNIGAGQGPFAGKSGSNLRFRTLVASGSISIVSGANEINISSSAQDNHGENIGAGQGIYLDNQGTNLRLRSISGSGAITVSSGTSGTIVISGSSFGEANTATNLGAGQGVFANKIGVDLSFRSLVGGGSISLVSGSNDITVSASAITGATNTGTGEGVLLDQTSDYGLRFRTLVGVAGTTISSGTNGTIFISSAVGGGSGEVNTASSLGGGQSITAYKSGTDLVFRSISASGSVSVVSGTNSINISSSAITGVSNTGTGQGIYLDNQAFGARLRSLTGSGGITVSSGALGNIQISSTIPVGEINDGLNVGAGQGIYAGKNGSFIRMRTLRASGSISIVSGATEINISSSAITGVSNTGTGQGIYLDNQAFGARLRSLTGSGGITVSSGALGTINISSTIPVGEINTASNTGTGEGIWLDKQGSDLRFRSLIGAGSTTVSSGTNGTIQISSTVPTGEVNTSTNLGAGQGLAAGKSGLVLQFRSLVGSGSISIVSGANEINISSSGQANDGENMGTGQSVYVDKVGLNIRMRSIAGLGGITVSSGTSGTINISSTIPVGEINTASNTGTGEGIWLDKQGSDLRFRSLIGAGSTTVSSGTNGTIQISSTVPTGEVNISTNLGAGQGIAAGKSGLSLQFRSLVGSGSISIVSGATEINISSSGQANEGESVGAGESVYLDKVGLNLRMRSISGSGAIAVLSGTSGTIVISGSSFGEANTATNLGAGQGVFANKSGIDLGFRSLVASGSISLISGTNEINISSSALTGASNAGTGEGIWLDNQAFGARFRTLVGSGGTTVSSGTNGTIQISSTVGGGSGEVNISTNLGFGEGLAAGKTGTILQFRTLTVSGSLTLTSGTDELNISSSGQANEGENIGSGQAVYLDKVGLNLRMRSIAGQGGITVSSGTSGTINISSTIPVGEVNTASNLGAGQGVFASKVGADITFRSLIASGSISIVSGTTEINISSSALTGVSNTGTGEGIWLDNQAFGARFRSLVGAGSTTVSSGTNGTIQISSTVPTGEVNTASNTGTGEGVWLDKQGLDLRFRSLVGSGGTTVSSGTNGTIQISSTVPVGEVNDGTNIGAGQGSFAGKSGSTFRFRTLVGSGSISIVSGANEINISSSGQANEGENIGSGQAVYLDKVGLNLRMRSIAGQGGITVSSGTSGTINISSTIPVGEINTASNTGTGEGVWLDKQGSDLRFRSLVGVGAITVSSGTNGVIQFSSSIPVGEINDGTNIGAGQGSFAGKSGSTFRFRTLVASGSISIVSGATEINISSSGQANEGENIGTGEAVYLDKVGLNLRMRSISGSGAITVSSGTSGTIIISGSSFGESNTASNLGAGQGVFANKIGVDLGFRSLVASGSISLISGTNEINISSSALTGASNTGTGEGIWLDNQAFGARFRTLVGIGATTVTSGTNGTIEISSSAGAGGGGTDTIIYTTITGGFGSNFWAVSSSATSTISGTTIGETQEIISLPGIALPSGTYRIESQFTWWNTVSVTSLQASMTVNGSQVGALYYFGDSIATGPDLRNIVHRTDYIPITGGLSSLRLSGFMTAASTASVMDAHISIWRVDQGVAVISPDSDQYILAMQVFS